MISYFPSELLNLNNSGLFLPKSIWSFLQSIGISKPTKRGCRSGRHVKSYKSKFFDKFNANIGSSMNVLTPNNSNILKYSLKIGLFNARSLCNKIALVTELIHENNIALLCVTETWLKVKDKAKIRELHELGFDIFSAPRAGRGGGVGFIFKSGFPIKNQKSIKFKSFEVTEAVILAQERIKICLMYRPGINKPKRIKKENISFTSLFWSEFEGYLSNKVTLSDKIILCGDFNFHFETNSADAVKFLNMID